MLSLLGFHTPHIEHAKVLEIGCGFGGNIISSALIHPNAHFVGVDLSETQIEGGKAIVNQLGLKMWSYFAKIFHFRKFQHQVRLYCVSRCI